MDFQRIEAYDHIWENLNAMLVIVRVLPCFCVCNIGELSGFDWTSITCTRRKSAHWGPPKGVPPIGGKGLEGEGGVGTAEERDREGEGRSVGGGRREERGAG
eukprot:1685215-Pyramimonas_sp.AAC.1